MNICCEVAVEPQTFTLFQSSSLASLAELFARSVTRPRKHPLHREDIIVQTAGMETWLTQQCAQLTGIFAGFEFTRPAKYLLKINALITGSSEQRTVFEPENMRWFILREIESNPHRYPMVEEYLGIAEEGVRRQKLFSFASETAELFDSYILYRPELLSAWEQGRRAVKNDGSFRFEGQTAKHEEWQMALWQAITSFHASLPEKNRGENPASVLDRLARILSAEKASESLKRWAETSSPVILFGMSILPPRYMELFKLLSVHRRVELYVLNPSEFYWGDALSDRQAVYQKRRMERCQEKLEYFSLGNRLLRNLGEAGRDFFRLLYDTAPSVSVHEVELFTAPQNSTMLAELQRDILHWNDMDRLEPVPFTDDGSITINRCFTPHREIETLYDWLLSCFDSDPDLTLGDVLIVTPEIETYAPLITMQFSHRSKLRGTVADRSALAGESVLQFAAEMLKLPDTRFTASEITSLFIRCARFTGDELSVREEEKIRKWVSESGIRWGSTPQFWHRRTGSSFGDDRFCWKSGLNRMIAGYAGGDLDTPIPPYTEIEGSDGELLGRLAGFVRIAELLVQFSEQTMSLDRWCDQLSRWFCRLFLYNEGEHEDSDSDAVLPGILKKIEMLNRQSELMNRLGEPVSIGFSTIRSALTQLLDEDSGTGFLRGSITFASMLPLRSVPFKIIGCIGMNHDSFPRRSNTLSFDLMRADPKPGDRDTRRNDLYLFLETLVSAEEKFYLSWVGYNAQSGEEIPAGTAVDQLVSYLDQNYQIDGVPAGKKLITSHPLHPFSRKLISGDPKLFTYQKQWFPPRIAPPLFEEQLFSLTFDGTAETVTVKPLLQWLTDPLKEFFTETLRMQFIELDETAADDEPFSTDHLREYLLRDAGVAEVISGERAFDETFRKLYYLGELPSGAALESASESIRREIRRFTDRIPGSLSASKTRRFSWSMVRKGVSVELESELLYETASGLILLDMGNVQSDSGLKRLFRLSLAHLLACIEKPVSVKLIARDSTHWLAPVPSETAERILTGITDLFIRSRREFVPWFGAVSKNALASETEIREALLSAAEDSFGRKADPFVKLFTERWIDQFTPEIEEEAVRAGSVILAGIRLISSGK